MITESPFDLAGIIWREKRMVVTGADAVQFDGLTVCLPQALRSAVPKRQSEYLAGRLCAAHALRALGLPESVGMQGRAPVWPQGAVGSISHSDSRAVAVVSRDHAGLGVDIEPLMTAAQAQEIQDLILTPAEIALRPPQLGFEVFLTLAFSAKESVYKALSPQLLTMPTFLDVVITSVTPKAVHLRFEGLHLSAHVILTDRDVTTLVAIEAATKPPVVAP